MPRRRRITPEEIREDILRVAEIVGGAPSYTEYAEHGRYAADTVVRLAGETVWLKAAAKFSDYTEDQYRSSRFRRLERCKGCQERDKEIERLDRILISLASPTAGKERQSQNEQHLPDAPLSAPTRNGVDRDAERDNRISTVERAVTRLEQALRYALSTLYQKDEFKTPEEQLFVEALLSDHKRNVADAALCAGYGNGNRDHAGRYGRMLLKSPRIQAAIARREAVIAGRILETEEAYAVAEGRQGLDSAIKAGT
jgi:phage terminase small subunit